ncbi:MAG: NAD-dependent epimerase/dehydratase family protein [candidate division NC10 bacterium]|nr:NAD-dependent epimerase/dehydratase family protein [candidate division NC10 bacterium]
MRVLVTGGTGFIGSHLVEALLQKGYHVVCLVREKGNLRWLKGLPVELAVGDLTRPDLLAGVIDGLDGIYHLAGVVRAAHPGVFQVVNHFGTRNLVEACLQARHPLSRFVHVSSQAAAGPSDSGPPVAEEHEPCPIYPYGQSKLQGEREILFRKDCLNVVVVRPPVVYGPRDRALLTMFRLVQRGFCPLVGKAELRFSFCYVEDLVQGLLLAGESGGPSGRIYHIASEGAYTWEEVGEAMAAALEVRAWRVRVPHRLLALLVPLLEVWGRLSGKPALLDRGLVTAMARSWILDISKAKRELSFVPRFDLKEGIQRTIQWYRKEGWL